MYFRNGNVEVNTGISLYSQSAKLDTIDTTGINDMVFNRNGVEYLRLNGASSILDVGSSITLSSNYLYCNFISQRSMSCDMVFKGANVAGTASVEYMRYRKADEDVIFSKDIYVNQDIKAYVHKGTGKNSYIVNENTAVINHFKLYNEDPNGDIRFYANNSIRLFITPSKVSVPAP